MEPAGHESAMNDRNITILHTEWSSGWGGQEIRILSESVAFRERGYNMIIACQPDSRLKEQAARAGIPVVDIRIRKGPEFGSIVRLMRVMRGMDVDLVHTHSSVDAWKAGLAARILGLPVVRSRHLSTPVAVRRTSYFVYMRLADRVITSGAAIRNALIHDNGMIPEKIVSIPAGIDEKRFNPGVDGRPVREELGLSETDFVVGIVSVLRSWKGHKYLIRAISALAAQDKQAKLLIVGAGPQEGNLRKLVSELNLRDRVVMTGHRTDVPECMAAMDCIVLPSTKNEATSQVLPQAMAMKKPVIATRVGGLAEVVDDGKAGLLVQPCDAGELQKAISWARDNPEPARLMAERGYDHCLKYFTFDEMINRTEAVYMSVLGEGHGHERDMGRQ